MQSGTHGKGSFNDRESESDKTATLCQSNSKIVCIFFNFKGDNFNFPPSRFKQVQVSSDCGTLKSSKINTIIGCVQCFCLLFKTVKCSFFLSCMCTCNNINDFVSYFLV